MNSSIGRYFKLLKWRNYLFLEHIRPQRRYTRSAGKTTKIYQQYFRDEWLELPEFMGWLRKDETNLRKAVCSFCQKSLNAKHSALLDHSKSEKHLKNAGETVTVETVVLMKESNVSSKEGSKFSEIFLQTEDAEEMPPDVQAEEEITETV